MCVARIVDTGDGGRNPRMVATAQDADVDATFEHRAGEVEAVNIAPRRLERAVANTVRPFSAIAGNRETFRRDRHRQAGAEVRELPAVQRIVESIVDWPRIRRLEHGGRVNPVIHCFTQLEERQLPARFGMRFHDTKLDFSRSRTGRCQRHGDAQSPGDSHGPQGRAALGDGDLDPRAGVVWIRLDLQIKHPLSAVAGGDRIDV